MATIHQANKKELSENSQATNPLFSNIQQSVMAALFALGVSVSPAKAGFWSSNVCNTDARYVRDNGKFVKDLCETPPSSSSSGENHADSNPVPTPTPNPEPDVGGVGGDLPDGTPIGDPVDPADPTVGEF